MQAIVEAGDLGALALSGFPSHITIVQLTGAAYSAAERQQVWDEVTDGIS